MNKKNQIVYAESQDYGKCIIQLVNKIIFNVKGRKLKSPIWMAYVLDSNRDRDFVGFVLDNNHLVGFFEDFDKNNFILELNKLESEQ